MNISWIFAVSTCFLFSNSLYNYSSNNNTLPFSGSGTYSDPYLISTKEDLASFSDFVNNGNDCSGSYVALTSNIDLEGDEITPIASYNSEIPFYGTFDGRGHTISNFTITGGNAGFFGRLGGCVANLGLENAVISGNCVGGIASHAKGSEALIINCYTEVTFEKYNRAGGIADNFNGYIYNSYSNCTFLSENTHGGMVSYFARGVYYSYSNEDFYLSNSSMEDSRFHECKVLPSEELDSLETANLLNDLAVKSAFLSSFEGELNKWGLNQSGLTFINERFDRVQIHQIKYLFANIHNLWPFLLLIVPFGIVPTIFLINRKKKHPKK